MPATTDTTATPPTTTPTTPVTPPNTTPTITLSRPTTPAEPPKPGSRRAALFNKISEKAGVKTEPAPATTPNPATTTPPAKPGTPNPNTPTPAAQQTAPSETVTEEEPGIEATTKAPTTTPKVEGQPTEQPGAKKPSPWALLNAEKEAHGTTRAELEQIRKQLPQRKSFEAVQKRVQELETEIRFVNYQKSQEFQDKYQKPYVEAWERALKNLAEIPVNENGTTRAFQAQDILELANLPLPQARALALQKFGDFAEDVMIERKEITRLFAEQQNALANARTAAEQRDKDQQAQFEKINGEIRTEIGGLWNRITGETLKDEKFGKYFSPIQGDEEGNQRLEKGFKLFDEAFSINPLDPRLTAEQRAKAIRKQVAVRSRAAAFGRLVTQIQKANAQIAELEAKLKGYENTEPPVDAGAVTTTPAAPQSARARLHDRLLKAARR